MIDAYPEALRMDSRLAVITSYPLPAPIIARAIRVLGDGIREQSMMFLCEQFEAGNITCGRPQISPKLFEKPQNQNPPPALVQ